MPLSEFISPKYLSIQKALLKNFKSAKPFPHLALDNFFKDEVAKNLFKAVSKEQFFPKESDLFKMAQTNDFASSKAAYLHKFRDFLRSKDFIDYMHLITGLKLKQSIDINGSLYQDTDYLLCHDDELEGRKIAFMIYFSDFDKKDGGSLALLGSKGKKPTKISKRIYPKFNTFTFFEVTPVSFHEVEEVNSEKQRITIGGWFHG